MGIVGTSRNGTKLSSLPYWSKCGLRVDVDRGGRGAFTLTQGPFHLGGRNRGTYRRRTIFLWIHKGRPDIWKGSLMGISHQRLMEMQNSHSGPKVMIDQWKPRGWNLLFTQCTCNAIRTDFAYKCLWSKLCMQLPNMCLNKRNVEWMSELCPQLHFNEGSIVSHALCSSSHIFAYGHVQFYLSKKTKNKQAQT